MIWKHVMILCVYTVAVFANDFENIIDEAYVKSEFSLGADEKMKYVGCKKRTYPTCEYIWGKETEKSLKQDAARKKRNKTPSGNKLMVTYGQASKLSDFDRVKKALKGSVKVDGIGEDAVWKGKGMFYQLSFITDKNVVISVNIDAMDVKDKKTHAMNVAKHILSQMH